MARSDRPAWYSTPIVSTSDARSRRCTGRGEGFESRPVCSEVAGPAVAVTPFGPRGRRFGLCGGTSVPRSTRCFRCSGGFESRPIRSTGRCQIYNVSAGQVTFRVSGRSTSSSLLSNPEEPSSSTAVSYDPGFRESTSSLHPPSAYPGHRSPALCAVLVARRTF